jgi:hypothetical protein
MQYKDSNDFSKKMFLEKIDVVRRTLFFSRFSRLTVVRRRATLPLRGVAHVDPKDQHQSLNQVFFRNLLK